MNEKLPRIMIVDDHAIFRKGLIMSLQSYNFCKIVGEAENGRAFIDKLPVLKPDLVILDIKMPEMDGFEATQKALNLMPSLKIIVLTMFEEIAYFQRMVDLGVVGFLLKSSDPRELNKAIQRVWSGDSYFSPELLKKNMYDASLPFHGDKLTSREFEVLSEICKGLSTQEIAEKLSISPRTVDGHRASLLEKTGSKNTAALIIFAIKNGLIPI
ncbi:MAG TPA: response regulator transcription factor [Salinivirgaceae bacterium]|nr:response regulator transcription factor [Salinivirgaceae bacterium]